MSPRCIALATTLCLLLSSPAPGPAAAAAKSGDAAFARLADEFFDTLYLPAARTCAQRDIASAS